MRSPARSKNPLRLTQAGEIFHAYLESQGHLDRQLESELRELKDNARQVIHIGLAVWRGSTLLPDILPRFAQSYPEVQVILHEAPVPQLGDLAAGSVTDFCLMHIPDNLTDLSYELVMHERVLLLAHRDHPLVRELDSPCCHPLPFENLRRLEKERLIMLPDDWRLSRLLHNLFSVQSLEPVNTLITTNNTTAINLVAENMGFTFLPESGIHRTPYMDRLSFFTAGEPPLTSPLAVVYKKNGFLSPAARTFMNLIKDYYRQFDRGSALTDS